MTKLTVEEIKEFLEEFVCDKGFYTDFVEWMKDKGYMSIDFE